MSASLSAFRSRAGNAGPGAVPMSVGVVDERAASTGCVGAVRAVAVAGTGCAGGRSERTAKGAGGGTLGAPPGGLNLNFTLNLVSRRSAEIPGHASSREAGQGVRMGVEPMYAMISAASSSSTSKSPLPKQC